MTRFFRVSIALCLFTSLYVTVACVYEYHHLRMVMPIDVVCAILALWGAYLAILGFISIEYKDKERHREESVEYKDWSPELKEAYDNMVRELRGEDE